MGRNGWLIKKRFFWVSCVGVVTVITLALVAFRAARASQANMTPSSASTEPILEPTSLEIVKNEVVNGLNHLFPFLNGTISDSIPFDQASRLASETDSDNDGFPEWQVYDFGSPDDDGYGGVVKIYDEGNILKYVLENFQTPSETWAGWISSPDTDQFPAGRYVWNLSIQTTQGTEQWQVDVNVVQESEEQFAVTGTLQLSNSQGQFQLVVSDANPLVIDALQPALLISGQSALTFTDPNGVTKQGAWTVIDVGTSHLWLDENANGLVDDGETADINYNTQTGKWETVAQTSF